MTDTRRAQATRLLLEGAVITLSILMAFSIDAWWENAQERDDDRTHLETVLRELQTTAGLLDDAIRLHARSQDLALAVLEVTSAGRLTIPTDSLEYLVLSLWNSYEINPPTGALRAATLSGTIGRLQDEQLKDQLLGWDGRLADLLEEEVSGRENAQVFMHEYLAGQTAMHGVWSGMRASVSGEATSSQARRELPSSLHGPGVESLISDAEFENRILGLLVHGQVSEDEAQAFRLVLDDVIRRTEATLEGF
jgi:hypothetical protein